MCGLAGILRLHHPGSNPPPSLEAIPEHWLDNLDASIAHRGPDGAGRFRDRSIRHDGATIDVALVHRRMSIIDHEGGHQPMVHDGQGLRPDLTYAPGETPFVATERLTEMGQAERAHELICVAFNGCIYNHRTLRAQLEQDGHVFATDHSDTEVLVHGYRHWRANLGAHLDAMHAFLLWDARTGDLAWGRDIAGEKPLYLVQCSMPDDRECFLFSSVARSAMCFPVPPASRSERLPLIDFSQWLSRGWADATELGMIRQPRPGGLIALPVSEDEPDRDAPTRPDDAPDRYHGSERTERRQEPDPALIDRVAEAIERAALSRLEADVPLGCFLSGGLDPALIASAVRRAGHPLATFTVRMPDPRYDESDAAAATARHLGTDHTTLDCDPNPAEDLVRMIEQLGLPFADSSLLPTSWVCRAAREHVKVVLTGDGGDELFGGYQRYGATRWLARLRPLSSLAALLPTRDPRSRAHKAARLLRAAAGAGYPDLVRIFPSEMFARLAPGVRSPDSLRAYQDPLDPLAEDFESYLPGDLLTKADTASMAVPIEARAPLLSRELVELMCRQPLSAIMPGGERKGLLKQIARRHLPDEIISRPKMGFAIPVGEWFRTDYGNMRTLLFDHLTSTDPFPGLAGMGAELDLSYVRTLMREHDDAGGRGGASLWPWKGRDHSQRLYLLLVLSIWCRWLERQRAPE